MTHAALPFDAHAHIRLGRVGAVAPSPCGGWLAVVVERLDQEEARYVADLWRVPLDGGAPTRLTVGEHRDTAPCFRADGALGFLSDRPRPGAAAADGPRRAQVWVLPAGGGEPRPVTDEPLGVLDFRFARAADRLVVRALVHAEVPREQLRAYARDRAKRGPSLRHYRAMPVRFWDHWLPEEAPHLLAFSGDGEDRRDLTPNAGRALEQECTWDLSADGARVAATWGLPSPHDRIYDRPLALIPTDGARIRLIGGGPGVVNATPRFADDGRVLVASRYTRSPHGYAHRSLWHYDCAAPDGGPRELTAGWQDWPVPAAWSEDGATVYAIAEHRGQRAVYAVDAVTGAHTRVTSEDHGGAYAELVVVPGRGLLAGTRSSMLEPPEPVVIALSDATPAIPRVLARLSGFDAGAGAAFARLRSLDAAIGDGRTMHLYILEPTAPPEGEIEAFWWIHGGPVAAWADAWHWRWCPLLLVAQGYTVVMPNPAGSTGYGDAWVNDIWGNTWGARCYEDLMGLVDVLEYDEDIVPAQSVIMGGSFGGYMANWIGGSTDRFRLIVTQAGLFSMTSFYATTDMPSWWLLMMGDTPYRDVIGFGRYSPSRRVANWRTPTLVIHGERDYRVPIGESLALFEALDYHGVTAELAVFPDEHHWIEKPHNIVAYWDLVVDFVARHWDDASE